MTREEAIKTFEDILQLSPTLDETGCSVTEAMKAAHSALRPVSREQVKKVWRSEWERITDPYGHLEGFLCKCGTQTYSASNFCPRCGGAMTNEAVQMVMERMEALYEQ